MARTDGQAPIPTDAALDALIETHGASQGALLPLLHDMMAAFGHVPEHSYDQIAKALGMTRAEVHGVVSFYHDFRNDPAGQHVIKLCRAEACQAQGGADVEAALLRKIGLDDFGTLSDGSVTVEPVYCLGLCACGPAALVDGAPRGRVTADDLASEVGA
ncbi:NAD(P)H-dependent oxidoreductase subunit E [Celeribacter sp.]|uniref:NAD(P)H-dependent oxidoreductase subunit E n=1 Tax=Celeribacter sp. TaxID=1890673 RepID=UPI003A9416F0